jgi:hypothetical protein
MTPRRTATRDDHPALQVTHQYSRCIERVLAALPRTMQRQAGPTLILAIARMRAGIVAPVGARPGGTIALASAACHDAGRAAVQESGTVLELMRRERLGSRADVLAALELLERIETALAH